MKYLTLFLLFFSFFHFGFSQINIPKKEKLLADFEQQVVTYSKKKKSLNFYFQKADRTTEIKSIDYSDKPFFKKYLKRYTEPIDGSIRYAETALERFKIFDTENSIYTCFESFDGYKHYTDIGILNKKTSEFKHTKIYSSTGLQGVRGKGAGTSCIFDNKLFQVFYNGFYYGITIHDLSNFEVLKQFTTLKKDGIDFKDSEVRYSRMMKSFDPIRRSKSKGVSDASFFNLLSNGDFPFICVNEKDGKYFLMLGSYALEEYENQWMSFSKDVVLANGTVVPSTPFAFKSTGEKTIVFFSTLDITTFEHAPEK